ncbi:levanase [Acetobacter estunensis NRIC 0472]|uniref:Glycoside hydrolase family 32 protein n=1 Tax=Acetobacter estunensis TaxID=104097 RepID=A0A967EI74_9PROT|nr:glycoside hydrolase family 32 protein [Acetobacter estunensis]NHO52734.1 glycoside hydrolase family 32 protein [Acetobacter estunensis]GBQ23161.1 levanase [Acetobacter estunensis NRIC 0472]
MTNIPSDPTRRRALSSLAASSLAAIGTVGLSSKASADVSSPTSTNAPGKPTPALAPDSLRKDEPNASHPSPADQPGATARPIVKTGSDVFYRPTVHFSPTTGFMNDPNGLVFDGERYHLYYQYDPFAPYAGHVHWGHASSTDMLHWKDQPIAIPETEAGEAFTGCAVMDRANASGLFEDSKGGMVALYTRASPDRQAQYLATSHDNGQSFTEYAHNPVLDIGSNSFRDPQVIFHKPTNQWVMVVAKSRLHQSAFYASIDLIHWVHLSDFGPSGLFGVDYECPNLIEVPIESGGSRWVLFVSVNPGGPTGGSITQYFVGQFDGTRFIPDDTVIGLTDFAKDAYALQVYGNMPKAEAVSIAWLGNWQYCQELPTQSWRGCMTLPRTMTLRRDFAGWLRLAQTPRGLETLRDTAIAFEVKRIAAGASAQVALPPGKALELLLSVTVDERPRDLPLGDKGRTGRFVITFGNDQGETLTIGFDAFSGQLWLDRDELKGFAQPFFTGQFSTVLNPDDRHFEIRVVLDACTLEIFANGGLSVGTALIFPVSPLDFLRLEANGAGATVEQVELFQLRKVMERETAV